MVYMVRENLFIGNISDAAEFLQNGSDQITHILSVLSSVSISFFSEWRKEISIPVKEIRKGYVGGLEIEACDTEKNNSLTPVTVTPQKILYSLEYAGKDFKFTRMAVPLRDMESENLLDYLDICLDFIEENRKHGSVLVHCFAGVSRSAAIITAYLMRSERLSVEDAIESLRQSCETVSPNDGFLEQLKMFEEMGFKVDHSSSIYKRFHLQVLGDLYNRGEKIESCKFGADPGIVSEIDTSAKNSGVYRCKKCRRIVALEENVLGHVPGEGESSFEWHKRRSGNPFNKPDKNDCSSIFLEPLRWMTTVEEGALEGKLVCTHCEARLGYFNWSGIQCSCGSWITPAFQLQKGRVDISTL